MHTPVDVAVTAAKLVNGGCEPREVLHDAINHIINISGMSWNDRIPLLNNFEEAYYRFGDSFYYVEYARLLCHYAEDLENWNTDNFEAVLALYSLICTIEHDCEYPQLLHEFASRVDKLLNKHLED